MTGRETGRKKLRVGFVPLNDAAPLLMAQELGYFKEHGLNVYLSREPGWATIRDKIIYHELDAAHAVAGMPFAATMGLGSIACDCLTALVLNLHGNAITLSQELRDFGVRNAASLRDVITRFRGNRTFTFGVVFPYSSHNFLLRQWLRSGGIEPDNDVRIVVVPPPQMVSNLKAGNLDGYCVGEPWNSIAVQLRIGWCVTTSMELAPMHPEKVLMVRRSFAESMPLTHVSLVAALLRACEFCERTENREQVISTLAQPHYLNTSEETLRRGLAGSMDFGHGLVQQVRGFNVFHADNANEPSAVKAAWVFNHIRRTLPGRVEAPASLIGQVFCPEIFEEAKSTLNGLLKHETEPTEEQIVVTEA